MVGGCFFNSVSSYFWSEDIAISTIFNMNKCLWLNGGHLSNSTLRLILHSDQF